MSPRGLLSAAGLIVALGAVSSYFMSQGLSLAEAWLVASLAVGGFLLVAVAP